MIEQAYEILFIGSLVFIAICMFFVIIKSIKGPRLTDRVVSVNMIGTLVIISICILSFILNEAFLLDVAFIYVLISFLAVVVLSTVYINVYYEKKKKQEALNEQKEEK
jgi:multicomponent Na+:H+ antiporter subunit F